MIVKLFEGETTDALSLEAGYDASKITPVWDGTQGELSIKFADDTTISEMKTALGLVELSTEDVLSPTKCAQGLGFSDPLRAESSWLSRGRGRQVWCATICMTT